MLKNGFNVNLLGGMYRMQFPLLRTTNYNKDTIICRNDFVFVLAEDRGGFRIER